MHHMFGGPGFWGGPGFFGVPWGALLVIVAAGVIIYLLVQRTKPAEAQGGTVSRKSAAFPTAAQAYGSAAGPQSATGASAASEMAALRREVEGLRKDIADLREALVKNGR